MIPYSDTLEDLRRHARRVLTALKSERTYYQHAPDGASVLLSVDREIKAVLTCLDTLADSTERP